MSCADALRAFCLELSSDQPSPGGGTASAASGAMAASLLVMVCEISSRSRKKEGERPELQRLKAELVSKRDELITLSSDDARAYDMVIDAIRKRKASPGKSADENFQAALKKAAQVPMATATACMAVLDSSVRIAEIGARSASSDVGVAVMLAEAGLKGAVMNVRINLTDVSDRGFAASLTREAEALRASSEKTTSRALSVLGYQ